MTNNIHKTMDHKITSTNETYEYIIKFVKNYGNIKIIKKYHKDGMEKKIIDSYEEALSYLMDYLDKIKDTAEYIKINPNNFTDVMDLNDDKILVDIVIERMIRKLEEEIIIIPREYII